MFVWSRGYGLSFPEKLEDEVHRLSKFDQGQNSVEDWFCSNFRVSGAVLDVFVWSREYGLRYPGWIWTWKGKVQFWWVGLGEVTVVGCMPGTIGGTF